MNTTHCRFATRKPVLALSALFAGFSLLPIAQAAERLDGDEALEQLTHPINQIEVGGGLISRDSYHAGDYTGLDKKGAYANGSIDLRGGDDYDSVRGIHWRINGVNLGLDSRRLDAEYGEQGKYRIKLGFDEIQKLRSDSYQTPFQGTGSTNLTLPANWTRVNNYNSGTNGSLTTPATNKDGITPRMFDPATLVGQTNLSDMHPVPIKTERKKGEVGFGVFLSPGVELKASYSEEQKRGNKTTGGVLGDGDLAALLVEPINYKTRQTDVSLNYTGKKTQFQVSYYGSQFSNGNDRLDWQDPWGGNKSGDPVPTYGQLSLAPANQFHQFNANGGYNFDKYTRLTASASRGYGTQNQAFLPYMINASTGNGMGAGTLGAGTAGALLLLPTNSLNGEVVTTNLYSKLTARPIDKLRVLASYKYDDRQNNTPSNWYNMVRSDGTQGQTAIVGGDPSNGFNTGGHNSQDIIARNLPRSTKNQTGTLEGDYAFMPRSGIKLGYDMQQTNRTYAEEEKVTENTFRADLRHLSAALGTSESIGYSHSERRGSNYNNSAVYFQELSPAAIAAAALGTGCALAAGNCQWNNNPNQRKFMYADRDRDRIRGMVSYIPPLLPALSLQANLGVNNDKYTNSPYGLTESKGWNSTLDATYAFTDTFVANAYFTHETVKSKQKSVAGTGYYAINEPTANIPGGYTTSMDEWTNNLTDLTDTFGIGIKHKGLMDGKLELGGDATVVLAKTQYDTQYNGGPAVGIAAGTQTPGCATAAVCSGTLKPALSATPLPDMINRSYTLALNGRYEVTKNSAIRASYVWQHVKSSDWAYDYVGVSGLPSMIGSMETPPNYTVQMLGIAYQYTFW